MAMTARERSALAAAKREIYAEKELRHRVRPGIEKMLADLMAWHQVGEQNEAIQNLILNAHALGPEGSTDAMRTPRHEITVSKRVAEMLDAFVAPPEDD
ncbi:hypothetical protein SAMN04490185_3179 [Pseudomonas frederiksbergensis]|uniref:Uncharacterized protein n=1 Tax=Pseudomonas frederiksbergensis TaxID=104087 RepID=A0A1H4ZF64_9PSED|nr:hypothetical protein [Pseudomonas frederiksbergensis]SED28607.1 hypothetical protein SAMN04490185_3179 [Pseudomonas frederiksbergensis]